MKLYMNKQHQNATIFFYYVKFIELLFTTKLPKNVLTYRRQVVNPRHQTQHGKSINCKACKSNGEKSKCKYEFGIDDFNGNMFIPIF